MSRLDDGHSTKISFAVDADVLFYEKTVTPPGIDAGGAIDTTTMWNEAWRTKSPKALKDASDASMSVAYDPACITEILAMAGVNGLITLTFPDLSTLVFYGWLDKFTPGEMTEGEQPTADIEIAISNTHSTSGAETGPEYAAAPV